MNVDRMRAIDFYFGKPLCFMATLVLRPWWRISSKHRSPRAPKNVLLMELSEMGSAILVDPAMRELILCGKEIFFVIFAKNAPSLALLGTVPEKNVFRLREQSLWLLAYDTWRFLFWCRRRDIDTVIDLELFSRFTALLGAMCGAVRRVGFYRFHNEGLYRGELLSHRVAYNPHVHISKNFLSLVHALQANKEELPFAKAYFPMPELAKRPPDKAEIAAVRKIINQYITIKPGARLVLVNANASDMLPQRRWPATSFAEFIRLLLAHDRRILVLLTGAPSEKPELERLAAQVANARCVNFAGAVQFMQLPALYEQARFMLTNDSGPAHFAAVTSMPTFVLFGPETPDLYSSLGTSTPIYAGMNCSPCVSAWNHRKTACSDNQCLKTITPQQVLEVIKPALKIKQVL